MKKICALCLTIAILSTIATLAYAAEPEKNVVDLGDGFYMVETITQYSIHRANDTVSANKTGSVFHGSSLVGTATLTAIFDISGSDARAIRATVEGTGYKGGTYVRGVGNCSGNTAFGTAYFKFDGIDKRLSLSIACSSDGTLS